MEGVARGQVRLLPHNPDWEQEFLRVKEELWQLWPQNILEIQHVGSTAIPAICASISSTRAPMAPTGWMRITRR